MYKYRWEKIDDGHSVQFRFLGLPTYPSPKLTLTLTSHFRQNDGLGEG